MKKFYLIVASLLTIATLNAQTIQGTIKAGSLPNSAIVSIKPSANMTDTKVSTFYFSIGIPTSVGAAPAVAILNNFNPNIAYALQAPHNETANSTTYYVYDFLGDGSQLDAALTNYSAAADNNMVEFTITGGGAVNLADVIIVNITNGGSTSNSYFNIYNKGLDVTNEAAMFYGSGAVNSAQGYAGTSFKPIGVTVPVHFLSFYAIKNGDDAKLSWTVENDIDNNYFEIQRSINGRNYNTIARVNAFKNGQSNNTYETADPRLSSLGSPAIYYRIKQVDNNGEVIYSPIRNLNLTLSLDMVNLFPNPARTTTKLVWDVQTAGKGTVVIRDALGRQVQSISMELVKGINQKDLNVASLPSGEYTVTVIGTNMKETIKLSKIN